MPKESFDEVALAGEAANKVAQVRIVARLKE
jgi:hypothetical protein